MVRKSGRRFGWGIGAAALAVGLGLAMAGPAMAQDEQLIERTGPPELDELETDANKDGIPDGWYNARDVSWVGKDGRIGPHFLRFQANAPGRPARISRAFGVDGRKAEAILLGVWVRQTDIQIGDRNGAEPALLIQFYGEQAAHAHPRLAGPVDPHRRESMDAGRQAHPRPSRVQGRDHVHRPDGSDRDPGRRRPHRRRSCRSAGPRRRT